MPQNLSTSLPTHHNIHHHHQQQQQQHNHVQQQQQQQQQLLQQQQQHHHQQTQLHQIQATQSQQHQINPHHTHIHHHQPQQQPQPITHQHHSVIVAPSSASVITTHSSTVPAIGTIASQIISSAPAQQPTPGKSPLSPNRRARGENKKCRKIYGMDNKEMWCTQCKWKKACSRFGD